MFVVWQRDTKLSPGWPFSDPNPLDGSDKPLNDFGNACKKQFFDFLKKDNDFQDFKDELEDQFVSPWLDPIKDFFGLGVKPESLGTGGMGKKKYKPKFDVDLGLLSLGLKYSPTPNLQLKVKAKTDWQDALKFDWEGVKQSGSCEASVNWSFP